MRSGKRWANNRRVELSGEFTLITGRTRAQADGMHQGRESEAYVRATRLVEMNEEDMADVGVGEGALVAVSTRIGQVEVSVKKGNLPRRMVFMPMGPYANVLIGGDTDSTGMPSYKGLAAEVKAL
jgi:formylmethanofuran dehydrogenase subunit D